MNSKKILVCQIGAREHYQTAVEFEQQGILAHLFTDYWAFRKQKLPVFKNLNNRINPALPSQKVTAFNTGYLSFELSNKLARRKHWELHMARNSWFQRQVVNHLKNNQGRFADVSHVFTYSYAAKEILHYAKTQGWKTILGQIDPGPLEEEIVMEEVNRYPQYTSEWQPAPTAYWDNWYQECELADIIEVNSEWSKKALVQKGIPENKIRIKPLNYQVPEEALGFHREIPDNFTKDRPLRVLFLGQLILRKGIARVIEVAEQMINEPVEFYLVGHIGIHPIPDLPNIKLIGRVSRDQVHYYYKFCDVFLFPTLSDGFGLTQLEALAWKLSVLKSPFAGAPLVKENIINMDNAEVDTICTQLLDIIHKPGFLAYD